MEFNRENVKRMKELILFTVVIIACFWQYTVVLNVLGFLFGVIMPFVIGGAIAFVLNVPMDCIERNLFKEERVKKYKVMKRMARPCSLILTILFVLGIVAVVMFGLIPQLGSTVNSLGKSIQVFIPEVQRWAANFFHDNKEIMAWINSLEFDWNKIMSVGLNFFRNGAGNVLDSTLTAAKSILSGLTTTAIAFVFACYILLQKERLRVQSKKVLFAFSRKGRAEAALEVLSLTYRTFSSFLTGQCVEAVILGSMFVVVLTIFRLPYALLIGIVIAFTALIPVFGAFIGCVIGAVFIFMVSPAKALVFIIIFLVMQQIEGNFIYPHVVGNSVGLPSIWVLAAVSIGGSLLGVVGILVFIPITSVLYALFREVVYLQLKKKKVSPDELV